MNDPILTSQDLEQLQQRGSSLPKIREQITYLTQGLPFVELARPATAHDGIRVINEEDMEYLTRLHDKQQAAGRFSKFVPASGAASRMFELLFEFQQRRESLEIATLIDESRKGQKKSETFLGFLRRIKRLAFYPELKQILGRDLPEKTEEWTSRDVHDVLDGILEKTGLNYGHYPKGLIKFHRYEDSVRCAFEEHLVEGIDYLRDDNGVVRVHFTVSQDYEMQIRQTLNVFQGPYQIQKVLFDVGYSYQKISTDTLALEDSGQLLRDAGGQLVFRPGGHGALLENLADMKADMVFIKNIDNVSPDRFKEDVAFYQRVLGGYLVRLQDRIFSFLHQLDGEVSHHRFWDELVDFCLHELNLTVPPSMISADEMDKRPFFHDLLNRPVRVCGMVRNQGEPGGGPFWVKGSDGRLSLQIVESAQVDQSSADQKKIWNASTHFNPVNLVCGLRNYRDEVFDLSAFVDVRSGLVTTKLKDGRAIRIFECPGLWNGSMAQWITVFVEVPIETFTPVKTVTDLLRPEHQG